ncbi:hypothetical protein [Croceicoccus mobilis]|uniref:Uncharacterized protein n=1 Tax=Croceicoccus mobilis TaxID=1703339 RepID=A0A916Z932_9SPHN|nr:hypothetical protein [Croceicoccus mobilis]GGD81970.1 hypothetical protein GCM10010990_34920 [Croceicoccus mobilis]
MLKTKTSLLTMLAIAGGLSGALPANAQQADRTRELYHIFDIQTEASRSDVVKAVKDGMNINVSDSQTITPLVRGTPPEEPGTFELVDPLAEGRLGGLGALIGAAQAAQIKQVKCDGAVWIATAQRRIRGSQTLRLTLCLFPYANDDARGYHLDAYALDTEEKGGGLSKRLGRLIAGAIVGNPEDWTNKTIVDLLREVHRQTDATVDYVEGQPAFTERPWENGWQVLPSNDENTEEP